jgi:hypothetical protein
MTVSTLNRATAAAMIGAAALATAGFTALGSLFDYPKILKKPTAEILDHYREHSTAISGWFAALVVGAALMAPIGIWLGRLVGFRRGRLIAGVGMAGAFVQVVGLSRWVLFVPGISDDAQNPARAADARDRFELLHTWLGTVLGETIGYALTAVFTVLVARALGELLGRSRFVDWLTRIGYLAGALIVTGVLVPTGLEFATLTNFAGYVLWCGWLVALGLVLWRSAAVGADQRDRAPVETTP